MVGLDEPLGAGFVFGVAVAIEEQDRGRLDAELIELRAQGGDLGFVQRDVDLAIRKDTLLRLEAQRALDQWLMLAKKRL
jgi:hypothetical protein